MTVRWRSAGLDGPVALRPVRHPQMLGQPDQHDAHAEGLVAVVAHVLHLEHDVGLQQPAEVESMAALDEPADRAEPQPGQPRPDEAGHVIGTALAVARLADGLPRGPLQIGEVRIPGAAVGNYGLAQRQVPSRLLVRSPQRGAKHLRGRTPQARLARAERRDEQRLDEVRVGLQREPAALGVGRGLERVEPGRDRVRFARPDPHHRAGRGASRGASRWPGGQPLGHQPVFSLGGLQHQPWDAGPGGRRQQHPDGVRLPRTGRTADEHVPVQRVERQHQPPGRPMAPVEHLADRDRLALRNRSLGIRSPGTRRLLGHVEIGARHQQDPGDLPLGRPGQRRDQLGACHQR